MHVTRRAEVGLLGRAHLEPRHEAGHEHLVRRAREQPAAEAQRRHRGGEQQLIGTAGVLQQRREEVHRGRRCGGLGGRGSIAHVDDSPTATTPITVAVAAAAVAAAMAIAAVAATAAAAASVAAPFVAAAAAGEAKPELAQELGKLEPGVVAKVGEAAGHLVLEVTRAQQAAPPLGVGVQPLWRDELADDQRAEPRRVQHDAARRGAALERDQLAAVVQERRRCAEQLGVGAGEEIDLRTAARAVVVPVEHQLSLLALAPLLLARDDRLARARHARRLLRQRAVLLH